MKFFNSIIFLIVCVAIALLIFLQRSVAQVNVNWDLTGQSCTVQEYENEGTENDFNSNCVCEQLVKLDYVYGWFDYRCEYEGAAGQSNDEGVVYPTFYNGPFCINDENELGFEDCTLLGHPENPEPTGEQMSMLGKQCIYNVFNRYEYVYSSCSEPLLECSKIRIIINGLPGQRIRVRSKCN